MPVRKLDVVLMQKQANQETPLAALGANDFLDVVEPATLNISPDVQEDLRGSGAYGNNPRTVGKYDTEITLPFTLYSRGEAQQGSFIRVWECAGWERRLDAPNIVMVPRNEIIHAATVWGYYGGPGTNKSLREKFGNVMFDGNLEFDIGKRAMITFTGKGKYVEEPAVATQPNVDDYREREVAPAVLQGSMEINGVAYDLVTFGMPFGQTLENNVDGTDTYGGGSTEMPDRNIAWTATVYVKPTLGKIPHPKIKAGTSADMDIQWGRTYNYPDCRIFSSQSVIHDVKPGNNNGIATWELSGYFVDNDVECRFYNGTNSSYSTSSTSGSSDSDSSSSGSVSVSSTSTSSASSISSSSSTSSESSNSSSSTSA